MDKEALALFRAIFERFEISGREQVVLKDGGVLTIYGKSDVTALISLPRGAIFELRKLGDNLEISGGHNLVQLKEFKVYLKRNKHKMAPNGWVINTVHGNMVTLAII
ncbi:MAG TPA: hypothetical protein VJI15_00330 [Candidatus Nanoarchaeia archaeon]|nr:hypothetical protein [Candidatus Nanoarchaeia archaeon]